MRNAHLNVEVEWLLTAVGGRRSPIFTGYRGQFHLHGGETIADVEWQLTDGPVEPGTSATCQVWFARPEVHLPGVRVGDRFEVREGARVVGRGRVMSLNGVAFDE